PDRYHAHRPSPAPRDYTTSFQGVERQLDLLAAGSPALSPREGLVLVRTGADHDVTVDRQVLERGPHRLRGVALGALLVSSPPPARPRQRRSLRRPRVALTEAVPVECRAFALPDRCGLRHPTFGPRLIPLSRRRIGCLLVCGQSLNHELHRLRDRKLDIAVLNHGNAGLLGPPDNVVLNLANVPERV